MRALLITIFLMSVHAIAADLRLTIEPRDDQTLKLSLANDGAPLGHTFVEFSTNAFWFPAFFSSSNSASAKVYTVTNVGSAKFFKATQSQAIASQVKASWQRLGVTNYVFEYFRSCFCAPSYMVRATATVMAGEVVKVENVIDSQGRPVENPSLDIAPTIDELFDAWVASEPKGGGVQRLEFDSNGFPWRFLLDPIPGSVDDELDYIIYSFVPLP